jgi:hypothetical protein
MLKKEILIPFVLVILLCGGCALFGKKKVDPNPKPDESTARTTVIIGKSSLDDAAKDLAANSNGITALSDDISKRTEELIKKDPKETQFPEIRKRSDNISFLSKDNLQNVEKLKAVGANLTSAEKKISDLEIAIKDRDKKIIEYNNEALKKTRDMWTTVSTFAGLAFLASICITILYSPKIGVPLMTCSIACVSASLFMIEYIHIVAIAGGVISLALMGGLLYQAFIERKALDESVKSFEANKYETWTDDIRRKVNEIQSVTTRQLVKIRKDKMKKDGTLPISESSSTSSESSSSTSGEGI